MKITLSLPGLFVLALLLILMTLAIAGGGLSDPCDKLTGPERTSCEISVYYP